MAKASVKLPEEFLKKISGLGRKFDRVAEEALTGGGEIVLEKARSCLAAAVGSGTAYPSRSTGELEASLGLSPVKTGEDGNHDIKVGFAEPRKDGGSNAKIAAVLEYGRHGQPARPFMAPAGRASRSACAKAVRARFEREFR